MNGEQSGRGADPKCGICGAPTSDSWLLCLGKYDSLRVDEGIRLDICGECAGKFKHAMRRITGDDTIGRRGGLPEGFEALVCPECGEVMASASPKVAAPCPKCGALFSMYSAKGPEEERDPPSVEDSRRIPRARGE